MNTQGREPAFDAVIPAPVRYNSTLTANAKLMYGEIRALSTRTGYCWADNEYFAELYQMSDRTIRRLITQLCDLGFITVTILRDSKGRVSGRRIYVGCGFPGLPQNEAEEADSSRGQNCPPEDKIVQPPDKIVRPHIKDNNINNISTGARENKTDKEALAQLEAWTSDVCPQSDKLLLRLEDFVTARRQRKKPIPPGRAISILTNRLQKHATVNGVFSLDVACEMIDNAILHQWDSVYPLKDDELRACIGSAEVKTEVSEKWL